MSKHTEKPRKSKKISKFNALKHGLFAKSMMESAENSAAFRQNLNRLFREYSPKTIVEEHIFYEINQIYFEKKNLNLTKTIQKNQKIAELLAHPNLPVIATAGKAKPFINPVPDELQQFWNLPEEKYQAHYVYYQELLAYYTKTLQDITDKNYAQALYSLSQEDLDKWHAFQNEHFETENPNITVKLKLFQNFFQNYLYNKPYNMLIAYEYKSEIQNYITMVTAMPCDEISLKIDKKEAYLDKRLEQKLALFFKLKETEKNQKIYDFIES